MNNLLAMSGGLIAALVIVIALIIVLILLVIATRYKKCPSDRVMVIYGKISKNADGTYRSAKCVHGGAAFVVPFLQSYSYLDLTPFSISVDLKNALSRQNIRVDVPSRFTVGISTEPGVMQNAAERLRSLKLNEIQELSKDIIFGQLRLVVATMNIEEINTDRDKFLEAISRNVEGELKKIGLRLINVNMTDITDESGYIDALGREAAAKAMNDAKISVAEEDKKGAIGQANAKMQERVMVAQAESEAIKGENEAKAEIANTQAILREKEAEALKRATAAEKVQAAQALEESYQAEKKAEQVRATLEKATKEADVIVAAEIAKRKLELEAEAVAEQARIKAKGEADATFAKMEAEARGVQEMLVRQASGISKLVDAAGGNPEQAVRLMIADKIEQLVSTQVEAIKNLKIDKVTVWDSGAGANGKTSTANFLSGLFRSLPPLEDLFRSAGLSLPGFIRPAAAEPEEEPDPEPETAEDAPAAPAAPAPESEKK